MGILKNGTSVKYKMLHNGNALKKGYHNGTVEIWSAGSTVTYRVEGVSYTEEVDYGATCLSPKTFTPAKSGWTFVGWREDSTASGTVLPSKVMGDDPIVLYAVFTQTITVTYYNSTTTAKTTTGARYCNDGNIANPSFTLTQAAKSGWNPVGWSTGAEGNSGIVYENGTTFTRDSNVALYGRYNKTCTLTCISYNSTEYAYGTACYNSSGNSVGATATAKTGAAMSGWTWRGWSSGGATAADAGVAFANGASVSMGESDHTIYGLYYKTITLYYNGNGATSGSVTNQTGNSYYNAAGNTKNPTFTLAANGYSLSGYSFNGWSTTASATSGSAAGTTVTLSASTTYFAIWKATSYVWVTNFVSAGVQPLTITGNRLCDSSGVDVTQLSIFQVHSEDTDDDDHENMDYTTNVVPTNGLKYINITTTWCGNWGGETTARDPAYVADGNGNLIASTGWVSGTSNATAKIDVSGYSSVCIKGYATHYDKDGPVIYISDITFTNS